MRRLPKTAKGWKVHGEAMTKLWVKYGLPPSPLSPQTYVRSLRKQVAPVPLTARRLKWALEEDLHTKVSLSIAQRLLRLK